MELDTGYTPGALGPKETQVHITVGDARMREADVPVCAEARDTSDSDIISLCLTGLREGGAHQSAGGVCEEILGGREREAAGRRHPTNRQIQGHAALNFCALLRT